MDARLPYLMKVKVKRGERVWYYLYVRIAGRRIKLNKGPNSPGFVAEYSEAVAKLKTVARGPRTNELVKGTLAELALTWFESAEFRRAEPSTQRRRKAIVEECLREPLRVEAPSKVFRECPVDKFTGAHLRVLRDRKEGKPEAANARVKVWRTMFSWAAEDNRIPFNPCRDVKKVKNVTQGFHTWDRDEVRQFITTHPLGTKAYLALALLLMTGVRRSDAVLIGRQHIRGDEIRFVPQKTRKKKAAPLIIPLLPALREAIDATDLEGECLTLLQTEFGRSFASGAAFGNRFKAWCEKAKLLDCTPHGLRKLAAVSMAEGGAMTKQLMAAFGWSSPAQAETYIRAASQAHLAAQAMPLIGLIREC